MNPDPKLLGASPESQSIGNTLALLSSHQNALQGGQSTPPPAPADSSGGGGILGFLGRNASTIGGIGGGIAGELIDPFGGGVIGASLGSSLGKAVQNENAGQSIGSGVVGAGIEGGLGQAAGFGVGKVLGGIGSKLVGSALKKALPDAASKTTQVLNKTKLFNQAFDGFQNENEPVRQMLENHEVDTDMTGAGENANVAAANLRGKATTLANAITDPIQRIRDEETLKAGAGNMVSLPKDTAQKMIAEIDQNPIVGNRSKPFTQEEPSEDTSAEGLVAQAEKAQADVAAGKPGKLPTIDNAPAKNKAIMSNADTLEADIKRALTMPGPNGEPGLVIDPKTGELSGEVSVQHALNIKNQLSKLTDTLYQRATGANGDITSPERKALAGIANNVESSLGDQLYNSPGVLESIQGRSAEAAAETRATLTQAGFDNNQINKAIESSAKIFNSDAVAPSATKAAGETSNDLNGKLSEFIGNARVSRGAENFAAQSGKAREGVESAAAQAAKPSATPKEESPAAKFLGSIPIGGPMLKAGAQLAGHFAGNPAVRAGTGGVLSKLAPTAGGDITKAGIGLGAMGTADALGPLVNPPATTAPAGQFTNTAATGGTPMQPPAQTAQPNPMGGAMLNYALFNPNLLSTLLTTANQQSQQNYASQQAQSALSNLPTAPGGLGAEIESRLGVGGAGAYNRAAQQAATQIAAAIPGSNPAEIAQRLTNYMAGGANIDQAQQALLSQLQLQQQQTTSGLSSLLGPSGLTQQPSVGLTPSLSAAQ